MRAGNEYNSLHVEAGGDDDIAALASGERSLADGEADAGVGAAGAAAPVDDKERKRREQELLTQSVRKGDGTHLSDSDIAAIPHLPMQRLRPTARVPRLALRSLRPSRRWASRSRSSGRSVRS